MPRVPNVLANILNQIYADPLRAIPADDATGLTDHFLDVTVSIDPSNNTVHTQHYRKADNFPFRVHRLPRLGGATPTSWAYTTIKGQFITFYRCCSDRWAFTHATHTLTKYLVTERGYNARRVRKAYLDFLRPLRRHNRYGGSLTPTELGLTALLRR